MFAVKNMAMERPYLFVVCLFVVETLVALPFVVAFKVLDLDLVPLRLIIPIAQSALMIWVISYLGWFARSGFTRTIRDVHVYWYPALLAFVPVLYAGTIEISPGWIIFYSAALIFTGISEEAFARGIALPALLPKGKWVALFFAAGLFSIGHLSNLIFENFGALEMFEKLLATFGFAVLYGALFIRTGNIWPLIVLHIIHDYMFLASGTAGPFTVDALPMEISIGLALANIAYGVFIVGKANLTTGEAAQQR